MATPVQIRVHRGLGGRRGREIAWRMLNVVFEALELQGRLSMHGPRKTFANAVYEANQHDLPRTSRK